MSKKFTTKVTNSVKTETPTSVWGHKGVPGKGGATKNANIISKKENE